MNVKTAAQSLSSSAAMKSNHPDFTDAVGTIRSIRIIDRLFDILNSRDLHGKGYKWPLYLNESQRWKETIDNSVKYLSCFTDINRTILL